MILLKQIARVLDEPQEIKQFAVELSEQLSQFGNIAGAEEILIRAEMYKEAVDLLNRHGQWEKAYAIAGKYLGKNIVRDMFIDMATKLEDEKKLRDAETVLLTINEPDLAISMYKKLEQYDSMIRLVEKFHPELVESTHLHLARQLESKGKFKAAENHFIAAGDWKAAVHMYGSIGMWHEAYGIAKQRGEKSADQVNWKCLTKTKKHLKLIKILKLIRLHTCGHEHYQLMVLINCYQKWV